VPAKLDAQLPIEALRDLLGLVRSLFAAWKPAQGPIELEELRDIGHELAAAYEMARKTSPNTIGHRAAWSRAEAATRRLGHLVGSLEPLKPAVTAAAQRVVGGSAEPSAQSDREAKRMHRRSRS
jgi:hypothetical protein